MVTKRSQSLSLCVMPSLHLSAHLSAPPSVISCPDPPWLLHCSPRLIDLSHKYFIFFLSSSTLLLCKARRFFFSLSSVRWPNFTDSFSFPWCGSLAGIRVLAIVCCQTFKRFTFQTPNTFITAFGMFSSMLCRKNICFCSQQLITSADWHGCYPTCRWVTFSDFNKVISINKWWTQALVISTGTFLFVSLQ